MEALPEPLRNSCIIDNLIEFCTEGSTLGFARFRNGPPSMFELQKDGGQGGGRIGAGRWEGHFKFAPFRAGGCRMNDNIHSSACLTGLRHEPDRQCAREFLKSQCAEKEFRNQTTQNYRGKKKRKEVVRKWDFS